MDFKGELKDYIYENEKAINLSILDFKELTQNYSYVRIASINLSILDFKDMMMSEMMKGSNL